MDAPRGQYPHLLRLDGATVGLTADEAAKVEATLRQNATRATNPAS